MRNKFTANDFLRSIARAREMAESNMLNVSIIKLSGCRVGESPENFVRRRGSYDGQNSFSNCQSRIIPSINGRLISISIACTFVFSVTGEIAGMQRRIEIISNYKRHCARTNASDKAELRYPLCKCPLGEFARADDTFWRLIIPRPFRVIGDLVEPEPRRENLKFSRLKERSVSSSGTLVSDALVKASDRALTYREEVSDLRGDPRSRMGSCSRVVFARAT